MIFLMGDLNQVSRDLKQIAGSSLVFAGGSRLRDYAKKVLLLLVNWLYWICDPGGPGFRGQECQEGFLR